LCSLQKIIVSAVVLFLPYEGTFADNPYTMFCGAKGAGMARLCVMNSDLWSSFHNQAGFAFNKSSEFGLNYENRFSIKELGTRTAGLTIPAGRTTFGGVYSCFGFKEFSRQMAGIACGMSLSGKLAAGIQIDYFSERTTGEYDNNQIVTCEAGIIILPSEYVRIGVHIFNPVPNSIRRSDMPAALRAGAGVTLNTELFAGIEAEMSTGNKLTIRTGFEYEAAKKLMLRGGFTSENNSFCFGIGYKSRPVIDFAFSTHERLGISSSISIIFEIRTDHIRKN
jgi:hypothetical protein